jgi:hypothetical protein
VDEKSVLILLVRKNKIEAEEDKKIFIIGIYLVLQDEVV